MGASELMAERAAHGDLCDEVDCERGRYQRGKCHRHWKQLRAREKAEAGITCSVGECGHGPWARGLCKGHWITDLRRRKRADQQTATGEHEKLGGGRSA